LSASGGFKGSRRKERVQGAAVGALRLMSVSLEERFALINGIFAAGSKLIGQRNK